HGTDRTDLGVSHGCIRLETRYARRLFHNVQVGTPVIIVGGEEARRNAKQVDLRQGYDPSIASIPGKPVPPDRIYTSWTETPSDELLDVLDAHLELPLAESRWDEIA